MKVTLDRHTVRNAQAWAQRSRLAQLVKKKPPSILEQHTKNVPTEQEIREAMCIAEHPPVTPGRAYCADAIRNMLIFPEGYSAIRSRSKTAEDARYALWYLKVIEIWAERKGEHLQQAILAMSDKSEAQLEADQVRLDVIELFDGARLRFARKVIKMWKAMPSDAAHH